jgi:high affinity Mn2+ porin
MRIIRNIIIKRRALRRAPGGPVTSHRHPAATIAACLALLLAHPIARADDAASSSAASPWTGWYAGGHLGWAGGAASTRTGALAPSQSSTFGSLAGGLQLGYALRSGPRLLALETDVTFPNFLDDDDRIALHRTAVGSLEERLDASGSLRARLGWVVRDVAIYGTGGLAWARERVAFAAEGQDPDARVQLRGGWTAGAGFELPVGPRWTARLEYRYEQLARAGASFGPLDTSSTVGLHGVWLGMSWHLPSLGGDAARDQAAGAPVASERSGPLLGEGAAALVSSPAPATGDAVEPPAAAEPAWNVHGQSTVVAQGHPRFRSPYEGTNSLTGAAQGRNTVSATAFVGVRAWEGGELYVNPELMQGFGLDDTRGVAGFPNGEAQRSNFPAPRFNVARLYVSQTFGLGGEREAVEDGPNQLPGQRDVSRITVTAGKLAVTDFFLVNAYAGEPRTGFLNWNVYGGGSYDWTMDLLSWTWGSLVELNQQGWAVRAGYFLLPAVSNTNEYDLRVPRAGQWTAELELRHRLFGRPGKVQLFGWLSHGNIGSYPAALAAADATGSRPDVTLTRGQDRFNSGVVASLEQPVSDDLGVFSRASWSPEQGETMGWTDCGESFSLGAVLKGSAWRRPLDSVGVAGLVEGLSPVARRYFEQGGMGTIIGDGALTYRPETILEAYYTLAPSAAAALTLDYQLIVNPGYNAERGPVSVFAVRAHTSF